MENQIEIYRTDDLKIQVRIQTDRDTVWLSQRQMAELFDKDSDTIGLHLKNIFEEEELDENSTTEYFSVVQKEGKREVRRKIKHYNLDGIISVGYRVNSKRGTQFRQWATQQLKAYLVEGYALNQQRLEKLGKIIKAIDQSTGQDLQVSEAKGLLQLLSRYTKSLVLLNQFDSSELKENQLNRQITYEIKYEEAKKAIALLKEQLINNNQATDLFGKEKDKSFRSSLNAIIQTFDGEYLYPSIEEQAGNLLYFIIKNHSFADGNKRIGAFLFVWFLEKNKYSKKRSGDLKINDNGLTALALLIAQSDPADKELMVQLVVNLINEQ